MKLRTAVAAIALAVTCTPALADVVKLTAIQGAWINAVLSPNTPITLTPPGQPSDPAKASWGTPFRSQHEAKCVCVRRRE